MSQHQLESGMPKIPSATATTRHYISIFVNTSSDLVLAYLFMYITASSKVMRRCCL